jgi:hypothetical protein
LFVIDLAKRRMEIAGINRNSDSALAVQCGRQLTDPDDGCARRKRFLLHDRDPRFTTAFECNHSRINIRNRLYNEVPA